MRTILVTGGSGQVGTELGLWAWPDDVRLVMPGRADLDLGDTSAINRFIADLRPDAVINSAAYTAVDKAQSDVAAAWTVNALAPAAIAAATAALDVPLIHVSTDYVFDGSEPGLRLPEDAVGPISVYGASKEGGEQAVRTGNPRHVIVRTAWVVSPHGANFVKTMLRVGAERPLLKVVDDQHGCPTSARDLADALARITLRHLDDRDAPIGTHHFVNAGETTWCGLAREVFAIAAKAGRKTPEVEAITTDQYPTPARRPAYSGLSTTSLEQSFGIVPRPWREAIAEIVTALV